MLWFEGSIAEAVAKSKEQNAIFVVFVEGEDELSTELAATLQQTEVARRLADGQRFLAVKLSSASPNYNHFMQIYQFVPVPSLFFIGRNGAPLEVVCGGIEADKLTDRIDRILQEHYKVAETTSSPNLPSPSSSAFAPAASASHSFIQSESQMAAKVDSPAAKVDTPAAKVDSLTAKVDSPAANVDIPAAKVESLAAKVDSPAAKVDSPAAKVDSPVQKDSLGTTAADYAESSVAAPSSPEPKRARTAPTGQYEVVCDGDVCVRRPKTSATPGGSSTEQMVVEASPPEPPLSERVERAKEIVEQKRREKEEKEKELERQKELERRATGQGVAELKRWQADEQLRQAAEERRREKAADDAARQRILQQIAQDRAERRAMEAPAGVPPASSPMRLDATPSSGEGGAPTHARIQFKLADGSSHAAQFPVGTTVDELHDYVAANLQQNTAPFSLWTAFPRRALPPGGETLRALGLAPSAALLVLGASGAPPPPAPRAAAVPDLFTRLYAAVTAILALYVLAPARGAWSWLTARAPPPPPRAAPPPARRTNVHRLPGDADDENNTWNGNSTQQM